MPRPKRSASQRDRPAPGAAALPPVWQGLVAATASALLVALAFPPWGLWPLAAVGWAPLVAWLEWTRPAVRRALACGWLAGFVLHLAVFPWLRSTMAEMSGMGAFGSSAMLVLYAVAMGVHQALFAGLAAWTRPAGEQASDLQRLAWLRPLLRAGQLACLWTAVEFAVPFLFPWYLGNAFYPAVPLLQAAEIIGLPGLSLLAMAVTALAVELRPGGGRIRQRSALAGLVVLLGLWLGYGLWRLADLEARPVDKRLRAAIVQPNPLLAEKKSLVPVPRLPMLDRAERLTSALPLTGVDLIVWPEGSLPFFYTPAEVEDPTLGRSREVPGRANPYLRNQVRRVHRFVAGLPAPLLFGTLRRTDPAWSEPTRNAAVLRQGQRTLATYDKRVLLAFGEYLPGTSIFPALAESIEGVSNLRPGTASGLMQVGRVRLLVTICYEALFGSFVRAEGRQADALVNLTDDVWFGRSNAQELHLMTQIPRTVEMRRPLVRADAVGVSALVDDRGRVVERTPTHVEASLVVTAETRDVGSPYRLWGDLPLWGVVALVAAWLAAGAWRRRRPVAGQ